MVDRTINKITKKELLLGIFLPFFILLLCLKGTVGNFDTKEELDTERSMYGRFEFSGHAFESSRTRSIFLTSLSLIENKTLHIPLDIQDFSGFDIGFSNGKAYAWTPPGTAFVGAIFYFIFRIINLGLVGAYLSITVVSVIVHFLLYKIVRTHITKNENIAFLSSYIYTFSTFAFVYSVTNFQHQYTSLFLCILLYGILNTLATKRISIAWSYLIPLIYGLSVFFDYPNIILLSPLMLVWFLTSYELPKKNRRLIYIRTPIIITFCISLLLLFNQINFDNPLQMVNTLPREKQINLQNIETIAKEKNNPLNIFKIDQTLAGLEMYTLNPKRGLFFFSPILLLGILGIYNTYKKRKRLVILLTSVLCVNLILYASFGSPSGGWCFGPRYLLPTSLILSLFVALWIEQASFKKQLLILPLLLLSILNNLSGALSTLTIPSTMETVSYGIKNLEFILNNVSGSFIYKTLLYKIPLFYYFLIIFFILTSIITYLIFSRKRSVSLM